MPEHYVSRVETASVTLKRPIGCKNAGEQWFKDTGQDMRMRNLFVRNRRPPCWRQDGTLHCAWRQQNLIAESMRLTSTLPAQGWQADEQLGKAQGFGNLPVTSQTRSHPILAGSYQRSISSLAFQ